MTNNFFSITWDRKLPGMAATDKLKYRSKDRALVLSCFKKPVRVTRCVIPRDFRGCVIDGPMDQPTDRLPYD